MSEAIFEPRFANDLAAWVLADPYIKRALRTTDLWDCSHVLREFVGGGIGLALLWNDSEVIGAMVYEIIDYPLARHFHIHLFSTDTNKEEVWLKKILPQVNGFAIGNGCGSITGEGRRGWARMLGAKINYSFELPVERSEEKT